MTDEKQEHISRDETESQEDIGGDWHAIEEAPAGEQAQALKHKWEELAIDVALIPERNVRLVAFERGERVEISQTMYTYFFQK